MYRFLNNFFLLLLLLLVINSSIVIVNGQSSKKWSGCIIPGTANAVRIGDPTRVCLHVANGIDWSAGVRYVRAYFDPSADEYSRFHIPNSYKDLIQNVGQNSIFSGQNITIGAASQDALSFLRLYYDTDNDRIYPFLTAIMEVQKGIVKGITWDDACIFCSGFGGECQENTYNFNGVQQDKDSSGQDTKGCYIKKEDCDKGLAEDPASRACDLTLYTVWTGTDVDGKALQSQAFRFSEFPAQEIADRITQSIPTFGLANGQFTGDDIKKNETSTTTDDTTGRDL